MSRPTRLPAVISPACRHLIGGRCCPAARSGSSRRGRRSPRRSGPSRASSWPTARGSRTGNGGRRASRGRSILALHGMNDSRDAWEIPAPPSPPPASWSSRPTSAASAQARAVATGRARQTLVADARTHGRTDPGGISAQQALSDGREHGRGGGDLPRRSAGPPPVDGTILVAPAIWGRSEMNVFERAGLWLMSTPCPVCT